MYWTHCPKRSELEGGRVFVHGTTRLNLSPSDLQRVFTQLADEESLVRLLSGACDRARTLGYRKLWLAPAIISIGCEFVIGVDRKRGENVIYVGVERGATDRRTRGRARRHGRSDRGEGRADRRA